MASDNLAREVATLVVDGLKKAGHVLVAKGRQESLLRELALLVEPVLPRVVPRILLHQEIRGEVTSTFGDEATDDAVEALVSQLREALLDSEGIEDVFADDVTIDRVIFKTIQIALTTLAVRADEEAEDEAQPPISVRLDTLGYVARTASKLSDDETLSEALERAAGSARAALDRFDAPTRTAFFAATEDDPDRRIEIEEAVEEALENLVDLGFVDLPSVTRDIALAIPTDERDKRRVQSAVAEVANRTLSSGVLRGSYHLTREGVRLSFTPLSQQDERLIDGLAQSFERELASVLDAPPATSRSGGAKAPANKPATTAKIPAPDAPPPSSRAGAAEGRGSSPANAAARLLAAAEALSSKRATRKPAKKAEVEPASTTTPAPTKRTTEKAVPPGDKPRKRAAPKKAS